jgi:hypothetical protein
MTNKYLSPLKAVLADRLAAVLLIGLVLVCGAYCVYVGISLRPSDLQVAIHYTSYGGTSFYREKWYYLISFIIFGMLVAVMHTALTVKLYTQGRRQIALLFVGLSLLLMAVAFLLTHAILKIAFL